MSRCDVGVRVTCALGGAVLCAVAGLVDAASVKNIVLVHDPCFDGSGWKTVYEILVKDGYRVSVAQEPLTSVEDDVAATRRVAARGPCILVAHSYVGTVATEAGTDLRVVG